MSDQPRVYLTKRRRGEEENKQLLKGQKRAAEADTETVAEPNPSQLKLTNVNVDCLEAVFMHLSFNELLTIAHTNKELKPAADLAFARKFDKKLFLILCDSNKTNRIKFDQHSIHINDMNIALKTVRCFGHLISKLSICPSFGFRDEMKIVNYVNQYCFKSAIEIKLGFINTSGAFGGFKKQFLNAEKVWLDRCTLKESFKGKLSTWFPNVRSLVLFCFRTTPNCIETHFFHLQLLDINGSIPTLNIENTLGILRLNPQLRSLTLNTDYMPQLIRCAHENLKQLESLDFYCKREDLNELGGDVFNFEHLKRLNITLFASPYIPISSKQLEEFTCRWTDVKLDNFIDFLKRHPSIVKLNVKRYFDWATANDLRINSEMIAKATPLLQEINFIGFKHSVESIILFTSIESLRVFRSRIDPTKFTELKRRLGKEWEATIDGNGVELQRKS